MAQIKGTYKCNVCGNIVYILHAGGGTLVCCEQNMELLLPKGKEDEGLEKHVPVIEKIDNGFLVKIGEVPHPMEDSHYIEWIEFIADGRSYFKFLNPGDAPQAEFCIDAEEYSVKEYCNLHGLWKA